MKEEILAEIKSFVFQDVYSKVSQMIDQYADNRESLLEDQLAHLTRAMEMISKVPQSVEGATMARGIAEEALSIIQNDRS